MIRIFLPLICAALGLIAASCSQSDEPFAPTEAPAAPHPTSHSAASAAMANPPPASQQEPPASQQAPSAADTSAPGSEAAPSDPTANPAGSPAASAKQDAPSRAAAERRASTLIGMSVVSADGSPLGDVKDIIFDRQGRATHVVIAYAFEPQASGELPDVGKPVSSPDGKLTAMPWDAAMASIKDERLVLDGTTLQDAPSFTPDAWPNLDDPAWNAIADAYWRKAVRAAIAAHPGNPIDSTTRQRDDRARGDRDGDGN